MKGERARDSLEVVAVKKSGSAKRTPIIMTIKFDRPIGTSANLKELEYISALHQTCFPLRRDGSIDGKSEEL